MSPKISIVVPVYNTGEFYLTRCLDSLINQTLEDIEIIIVNDCSPNPIDEKIILEYAQNDLRIKYFKHEKNKKLGGARNTGIKNATCKWITFVDSDDYVSLHLYKQLIDLCEQEHSNIGIFNMNYDIKDLNINTLEKLHLSACMKIVQTEDLKKNNLYFPEDIKGGEDFIYNFYLLCIQKGVSTLKGKQYYYVPQGIIPNVMFLLDDFIQSYYNTAKFLKDNHLWELYKNIFFLQYTRMLKCGFSPDNSI